MIKAMQFKDKDGRAFVLSPMGYEHIRREHHIADPVDFIKDTLLIPLRLSKTNLNMIDGFTILDFTEHFKGTKPQRIPLKARFSMMQTI